ncbi:hypothetical protein D3C80_2009190 [compost metagenome]
MIPSLLLPYRWCSARYRVSASIFCGLGVFTNCITDIGNMPLLAAWVIQLPNEIAVTPGMVLIAWLTWAIPYVPI